MVLSPVGSAVSEAQTALPSLSLEDAVSLSQTDTTRERLNLRYHEISILLHMNALNVIALLVGGLEPALPFPVDGQLTILLHFQFDGAIWTPQALADLEPLAVLEGTRDVV